MLDFLPISSTNNIAQLDAWRAEIDACLVRSLDLVAAGSPLRPAMIDALLGPGKRLRPLLTLASFAAYGDRQPTDAVIEVACAFELLHAASLIYDDLPCMDDSAARRGAPALHIAHGEATALLAAISLTNAAYRLATPDGLAPATGVALTRLLAETAGASGLAAGQYHDLNPHPVAVEARDGIRRLKTGVLFSAAATAGRLCAGMNAGDEGIDRYAEALGTAFQLLDDLDDHDAAEDEARLRAALAGQVAIARAALADNPQAGPLQAYLDLIFGAA